MSVVKLNNHSTSRIFKAIQRMMVDQGFTWNDDISDTNLGKMKNKEFKLIVSQVDNSDLSNRQNFRLAGTFEITTFHNAQGRTEEALLNAYDDIENIIFEIERFAPEGSFADAKALIQVSRFSRWNTEPIKSGDDSRIRTIIVFDIKYIIRNPKAT